jgi:hypothetical protein
MDLFTSQSHPNRQGDDKGKNSAVKGIVTNETNKTSALSMRLSLESS